MRELINIIRGLPAASQPGGLFVAPAFASEHAYGVFSLREPLQSLARGVPWIFFYNVVIASVAKQSMCNSVAYYYFRYSASPIVLQKLFEAVDWPLMLPRLIVDRIRRDGRRPPVCFLCGASVRFRAPPVPESEKNLRTARLFSDHSLRFESCRPLSIFR